MPIRDYRDSRTASFVEGARVPAFAACERQAIKGIARLQAATRLVELRNPPSNKFEALEGDRRGEYSLRIDRRWRICFHWAFTEPTEGRDSLMVRGEPFAVEITDHYE